MSMSTSAPRRLREKRVFFDRLAPAWHRDNLLTAQNRDLLRSVLPPEVLDIPGLVVDLGGGTGRLAGFLREVNANPLLVFDLSRRMLRELRDGSVHRVQGDAHHLPLRDRSVRLVFCFSAFPHFERQLEVLKECRRILRPGGYFVVLHDCSREEINRFHSAQAPVIAGDHLPSLAWFRRWGEKSGMIPERLENRRERFLVRYQKPLS